MAERGVCVTCRHPYKSPQHGLCVIRNLEKRTARHIAEQQRSDLRAAKHYCCAPEQKKAFCLDCGVGTLGESLCLKCHEQWSDKIYRLLSPDAPKRACKTILTTQGKPYRQWLTQAP